MLTPLVKVRGQRLSDGSFICGLAFFGFGASGSDCCPSAVPQDRKSEKIKAQMTDAAAPVAGIRFCTIKPPADFTTRLRVDSVEPEGAKFSVCALRSYSFPPLRS